MSRKVLTGDISGRTAGASGPGHPLPEPAFVRMVPIDVAGRTVVALDDDDRGRSRSVEQLTDLQLYQLGDIFDLALVSIGVLVGGIVVVRCTKVVGDVMEDFLALAAEDERRMRRDNMGEGQGRFGKVGYLRQVGEREQDPLPLPAVIGIEDSGSLLPEIAPVRIENGLGQARLEQKPLQLIEGQRRIEGRADRKSGG